VRTPVAVTKLSKIWLPFSPFMFMRANRRGSDCVGCVNRLVSWYARLPVIPLMRIRRSNSASRNPAASSSSSSGWLGGLASPGSSIGSISPTPKNWCHTRFATFLAKYGFFGDTTQSANSCRGDFSWFHTGVVPSMNRADTCLVEPSLATTPGMVSRFLVYCGSSGPMKFGPTGGSGLNSPKKAANCQNCSRVYGANGWSWHWAHSSFTPSSARVTVEPTFSGLTSSAW